jgi:23S rRNA pseudouridine1911/1915/1917 synthase
MNEIFQKREVSKTYQAWVEGKPMDSNGLLTHWLKRDEKKNFTKAFSSFVKDSLEAKLKYKVLKSEGTFSLLEIDLLTGRKHQIRAQLSAMGNPIVGDAKYGAKTVLADIASAANLYKTTYKETDLRQFFISSMSAKRKVGNEG